MFTDVSKEGWGAVLITPHSEVFATGAQWNVRVEINKAEALAVEYAFHAFTRFWNTIKHIRLMIDNTSVEAAIRKKWADSEQISQVLGRIL